MGENQINWGAFHAALTTKKTAPKKKKVVKKKASNDENNENAKENVENSGENVENEESLKEKVEELKEKEEKSSEKAQKVEENGEKEVKEEAKTRENDDKNEKKKEEKALEEKLDVKLDENIENLKEKEEKAEETSQIPSKGEEDVEKIKEKMNNSSLEERIEERDEKMKDNERKEGKEEKSKKLEEDIEKSSKSEEKIEEKTKETEEASKDTSNVPELEENQEKSPRIGKFLEEKKTSSSSLEKSPRTSFRGFSRSHSFTSSSSSLLSLLPPQILLKIEENEKESSDSPSKIEENLSKASETIKEEEKKEMESSSITNSLDLESKSSHSPINLRNSYSGDKISTEKSRENSLSVSQKRPSGSKSADPNEIASIGWGNLHLLAKKTKPTKNEDMRNKKRMELLAEEDPEKKKKEEEEAKKRGFIVQEMLKTERNYVNALKILTKTFYEPLLEKYNTIGLASQDSIHKMFNKVDILYKNHQRFLGELEGRVLDWNPQKKIGDLFLNETDFLLRYRHYVNNYNNAFAILTDNKKIPEFKQFLASREAQPECHHSDLQSFLLEPIQRIPRYEMLLRDLNRKTDKEHPDHKDISAALQKIEEITKWINDAKRNSEQIAKVEVKLTDKVAQTLWLSNRKYFGEGKLTVISKGSKERYVFLFNNLLLLCKETKNSEGVSAFKIKEKIGIEEELILANWKEPKEKSETIPMVSVEIARKKLMFQGATKEESQKWHKMFSDARDHFRDKDIGETLKTNKAKS
eukprot:TRINITY_DN1336_c0_g1_i2.p1 TRINITY_DN1336_c0_g1~~TRINITY_DN1336_c0_g1_i2.p1  ORF type:complete len:754 (+),score=383.53 TRINITY_DN1336_c0_g1_i2:177-2438(+)